MKKKLTLTLCALLALAMIASMAGCAGGPEKRVKSALKNLNAIKNADFVMVGNVAVTQTAQGNVAKSSMNMKLTGSAFFSPELKLSMLADAQATQAGETEQSSAEIVMAAVGNLMEIYLRMPGEE